MVEENGTTGVMIEVPIQIEGWAEIPLTRDRFAKVDQELATLLCLWKWYASTLGYAVRKKKVKGRQYTIWMHRFIWEYTHGAIPEGMQIDHINGDRLDNRISNLRVVTNRQNSQNKQEHREGNKTSRYVGVVWRTRHKQWEAQTRYKGRSVYLGMYRDEYQAHLAYLAAVERIERGEEPRDYSSRNRKKASSTV